MYNVKNVCYFFYTRKNLKVDSLFLKFTQNYFMKRYLIPQKKYLYTKNS